MIDDVKEQHEQDFAGFLIDFDNFYTTHSKENREFSESIYLALEKMAISQKGPLSNSLILKKAFLADRYVVGACPKCHAENQYGDNCEVCGSTYSPLS